MVFSCYKRIKLNSLETGSYCEEAYFESLDIFNNFDELTMFAKFAGSSNEY